MGKRNKVSILIFNIFFQDMKVMKVEKRTNQSNSRVPIARQHPFPHSRTSECKPRWGRSSFVITALIGLAMATVNAGLVRAQYVYPQRGQSPQQQQRDENECSNWATQQTGYRPSGSSSSGGGGVLRGAARGAGIGAIGGAIGGDAGTGAAVGAAVGGISGGIRNHDEQSQRNEFDRAFASCMQDRGYSY